MAPQRRTGRSADDGFTADSDCDALESARAPAPAPESRRRVTMPAQSVRSRATRPASASSCSAMPSGDVNALSMMEPRLSLGCGCGGREDRVTDDPSGEEHRGQRQQRRVEESGSDEQLRRRYRREREHSDTARPRPPALVRRRSHRVRPRGSRCASVRVGSETGDYRTRERDVRMQPRAHRSARAGSPRGPIASGKNTSRPRSADRTPAAGSPRTRSRQEAGSP